MKTLVLIGNAPLKSDLSEFINSCDCVVRFNNCRNYGIHSGTKSDILFLNNTGDPRKQKTIEFFLKTRTRSAVEQELPYTKSVRRVVFVRPSAHSCKAFLEDHVAADNPLRSQELRDIALDRNLGKEIVEALFLDDREIEFVTADFYAGVWKTLLKYGHTTAIMPSTGIVGLQMLLHCESFKHYQMYIAGFGQDGWEGHPWELEKRLLNDYIRQGVVIPLDDSGNCTQAEEASLVNTRSSKALATIRPIRELFLVSNLRIDALDLIRQKYPHSRVLYWDSCAPNEIAVRRAAELAQHIIAEKELVAIISAALNRPVTSLGRFNPDIAQRLENGTASVRPAESPPYTVRGGPILFCPWNDTHVKTFAPISNFLRDSRFLLYGDNPDERAEQTLQSLGLEYCRGVPRDIASMNPSVLVLAKDWSPAARRLMAVARRRGIPVACLQEGPTEFGRDRRMQRCDYPLVQGPIMLRYLDQHIYFLTGNARFDRLEPVPPPNPPLAMLNCNFWNDNVERTRWLESAVAACQTIGIDFFISRHPRDTGELPNWPTRRSGPDVVHRHLADSSVAITPHSSIIYEALLMGRSVICHDPRRATIDAFQDDRTGAFTTSHDQQELVAALAQSLSPPSFEQRARIEKFLDLHCGTRDMNTARRCASALAAISWKANPVARSVSWPSLTLPISHAFAALRQAGNLFVNVQ